MSMEENAKFMHDFGGQIRNIFNKFLEESEKLEFENINNKNIHSLILFPLLSVMIEYCADNDLSPDDVYSF